jgi:outer membrane protein assembly factor BamB
MSQPAVAAGRVVACYPNSAGADQAEPNAAAGPVDRGRVVRGAPRAAGKGTHAVAAFDVASGRALWAQAVPADCISAPVVADGTVHVTTLDGTLTQVELATGRLQSQEQRNATSAPWVAPTRRGWEALVSQREARRETASGRQVEVQTEGVRKIDPKTGQMSEEKLLFGAARYLEQATVDRSEYFAKEAKVAADSAVGFSAVPGQANLTAATGNVGISRVVDAWSFQGSRPLVSGERLVTALGNRVTAASPDGRQVAWAFTYRPKLEERLLSPPAAAGRQVVFTALDGAVFSLELGTGRLRHGWRFDKRVVSQPAVVGGRIFFGTLDGWLVAIDTGDRTLDGWAMWGGGPAHNGPSPR